MTIGILGVQRLEHSTVLHHFIDAAKELSIDIQFYVALDFVIKIIDGDITVVDREGKKINIDALINWIPYCKYDEISYAFQAMGIPVLNNIQAVRKCSNKMLTSIVLSQYDVLQPDSEYYPLLGHNKINPELSYPIAFKEKMGTYAIANKKLYDQCDLKQLLIHKNGNNDFYIEELINNDGLDIRAVIVGDNVLGAIKNDAILSYDSKEKLYEIDLELENICLDITQELDLHFVEIDLMLASDGMYYVLDVNAVPELEIFEDATGVDVAKEILKYTADMLECT